MKIAIIGSSASGKTTFLTMLSEYCRVHPSAPIHMRPVDSETNHYVARHLSTMAQGKWPDSTTPGAFRQLRWNVCFPGRRTPAELHVCDITGEDFREFYTQDHHLAPIHNIRKDLRPIRDYIVNADMVVMLVDVKDFTGQLDPQQLADSRFMVDALFEAMKKCRHRLLVATKADLWP